MNLAALQMTSTDSVDENLNKIESLLATHKEASIDVLVLPENFALMAKSTTQKLAIQEDFGNGMVQTWLNKVSKENDICIIAGSFPIRSRFDNRPYARCLVYDRDGSLITFYDKMHLFDVAVSNTESYCESNDNFAGNKPVVFEFEGINIGLSICYDLRFPELYRFYQQQGVDVLTVPSAFTFATGKAHWNTLLRARAIENLSYLVASNQTGTHANGRKTFGHSQIIGPWGEQLAMIEEQEGLIVQEISKAQLSKTRSQFPVLEHRKL